jgi:chromate transport protein ChrA
VTVSQKEWLSQRDFDEIATVSQMLPGGAAANSLASLGLRFHGVKGAALAYLACGLVDDPRQTGLMLAVAVMLGVGQIAAIIAGQTLLGQEAPRDLRGAVFGLAGVVASAAILFTNAFGGWLYDSVSRGGPIFLLAAVNFAIFAFGLRVARRTG